MTGGKVLRWQLEKALSCVTRQRLPADGVTPPFAALRDGVRSGGPPFKAAVVGAPPPRGFAREGAAVPSAAPSAAHAHRMPCRLSGLPPERTSSPPLKPLKLLCGRCERRRTRLFSGTPGTSRARPCAVRGAANEGRDPKTGTPRNEQGRTAVQGMTVGEHCRLKTGRCFDILLPNFS